jgi:DNA-binding transcriptional ArsR family regulator
MTLAEGDPDSRRPDSARVLRHPLRQRLLYEYAASTTSPSKLAVSLSRPLNLVSYHTNMLRRAGHVELVRVERRRGAHEHFYRAAAPQDIDDLDWSSLPTQLRRALVRSTMDLGWREIGDALVRGGMDDATAHVSRTFLTLDSEARAALAAVLRSALARAQEMEAASLDRGRDDAVPCELVIMSFERSSSP